MAKPTKTPGKKSISIIAILGAALALAAVLAAGGLVVTASQESHDSFCASCHSQPETTYYQRSTGALPLDLASAHTGHTVGCIDCHSGVGLTGRVEAELLGARNAAFWYTGTAVQPAKLTVPISDQNCLKCHQDVTAQQSRSNHFHGFLARWQAADPNAAFCVSCHSGHATGGNTEQAFVNEASIRPVCEACHAVLHQGD